MAFSYLNWLYNRELTTTTSTFLPIFLKHSARMIHIIVFPIPALILKAHLPILIMAATIVFYN